MYPNYAHNRACALPPPSPFHYVMAKIVPVVQLATHAKSSTLYGRSYGRTSKFFWLDGLLLFRIIMGNAVRASRAASSAIAFLFFPLQSYHSPEQDFTQGKFGGSYS